MRIFQLVRPRSRSVIRPCSAAMSWFNRGGDDWFTTLFGFSEDPSDGAHTRHSHVHSKIEVQRKDDGAAGFILRSNVNGNSFDVGAFKNPSLAELRAAVAPPANPGDPALTIKHIAVGDVFELHTRAENQGAMFQAASQFNCLEMASPHAVPEDGVTIYEGDQTQGPACSLAAGPATVYRNYFADVNGQKGQTQGNQINNLHELLASIPLSATAVQQLQLSSSATNANSLIPVVNGYSNLAVPTPHTSSSVGEPYRSRRDHGTAVLRQLQELIETVDRDELRRRLRIGVHSQVEVPFASRYKLAGGTTKHTVSQAFCSALAIGYVFGKQ